MICVVVENPRDNDIRGVENPWNDDIRDIENNGGNIDFFRHAPVIIRVVFPFQFYLGVRQPNLKLITYYLFITL